MSDKLVVQTPLHPYLDFNGRCEEAINFYRDAIGAELVHLSRFKDAPPTPAQEGCPGPAAENGEKVMHATVKIGPTVVMMADGRCGGQPTFAGFWLTLGASTAEGAAALFNALAPGGKVIMPLGETFFAASFGMLTDRFGLGWMVIAEKH